MSTTSGGKRESSQPMGSRKSACSVKTNNSAASAQGVITREVDSKLAIKDAAVLTDEAHRKGFADLFIKEMKCTAQCRAGVLAFTVLTGSYIAKCTAKTMHKEGRISCRTYRKVKEMTMTQPWFCLPLIGVALLNKTAVALHPPCSAYALLFSGWLANSIGHSIQITCGQDTWVEVLISASYGMWMASMGLGCAGIIINTFRHYI